MNLPSVKICGLTRTSDAQMAVALGARLIGLVFAQESARRISFDQAKSIVSSLPPSARTIGVFSSASEMEIVSAIEAASLHGVQVDRNLTPAFYAELKQRGLEVIRAISVTEDVSLSNIGNCDALLFDSPRDGSTRRPLNAETVQKLKPSRPFYIAGGLNAENIGVYVNALRPSGVDLSSGVESSPGIKSERALKDFFTALRAAGGAQ